MNLTGSAETSRELQGSAETNNVLRGKLSGLDMIHGYSAYEIAVINGFSGSEEEWLETLKGEKGEPGAVDFDSLTEEQKELLKGDDGEPGRDGVSATHSWDGTVLTITSASGNSSADLKGEAGNDGVSPSITVSTIVGGHRVTITDVNGTKYFDVMDGSGGGGGGEGGADGVTFYPAVDSNGYLTWTNNGGLTNPDPVKVVGEDGSDGEAGKDGVSVTHSWNGTTLTVTSASGTSSANLKGDKGDNGTSVTHSWNGTKLTVTSASGTSSADLKGEPGNPGSDGADGYTPVKGTDYWTAADKAEMVNAVLAALPAAEGVSF